VSGAIVAWTGAGVAACVALDDSRTASHSPPEATTRAIAAIGSVQALFFTAGFVADGGIAGTTVFALTAVFFLVSTAFFNAMQSS